MSPRDSSRLRTILLCLAVAPTAPQVAAQVPLPDVKPIPVMTVIPEPYAQASIRRSEQEISRYHFGDALRRPFLYPLIGPSGQGLTRMGHPHDPVSHSHHNSVWISHHDVNGLDFWGDRGQGRIVHRRIVSYEDGDASAAIDTENAWVDETGRPLLLERRRMTVVPLTNRQWMLLLDLQLAAAKEPVTLGKTPFGLCAVRMAKTIGVRDGGGLIRNSEGGRNEEGVFWKQARWVDYSGQLAAGVNEGITLMDHPGNMNYPSYFHVRDDGWMGSSLTFDGARTIEMGRPLVLRYGLWIHAGVPEPAAIQAQYDTFAGENVPEFTSGKR